MKIRGYFEKTGRMVFIGHLDLLKLFQRTVSRAGLPIAYSTGFNPHQQMGFALPLSLGYAGLNEIIELEMTDNVDLKETAEKLNKLLPDGIRVKYFQHVIKGKAAALVTSAVYEITNTGIPDLHGAAAALMAQTELLCVSREKEVDIRPMIFDISVSEDILTLTCMAGSIKNLNPSVFMSKLFESAAKDYEKHKFKIRYTRKEMILANEVRI